MNVTAELNRVASKLAPDLIPPEFRTARRRFVFYAYCNRLLAQLPLSLTLGGVLYSVSERIPFRAEHAGLRVLIAGAAVLLVPLVAVWLLDRNTLRGVLQRWMRGTDTGPILFYFLFYVRRFLLELRQLDDFLQEAQRRRRRLLPWDGYRPAAAAARVRRVQAAIDHLEFLADVLSTRLEAPTGSFLAVSRFVWKKEMAHSSGW